MANLLAHDSPFSESENRVLEQRPDLSLHAILSGKFASDYESYTSDQFVLRDAWVGAKTDADRALGKKESNGVFLGKDEYLIERYRSPSETEMESRVSAMEAFGSTMPGLRMYVMLAPTAAGLLRDKLPAYASVGDEQPDLGRVKLALPPDIRFVDVYPVLDAVRETPIYYKTDHHWTTNGAYYAYRELCRQMGLVPQAKESFDIREGTDRFYGSLYSKSGFRHLQPDRIDLYLPKVTSKLEVAYMDEGRITDSMYEPENLGKKDKYAVFLNGNHGLVRITTDGPADKKLLVVKDSYANCLIPFLTKHFGEIDVVDLRYDDEPLSKLVQERQIQDMLILYNINTFFEDPSILNLTEG